MLASEKRNGCISLLPVPMVSGVLSEAAITPSKVRPCGEYCSASALSGDENDV